ncbi:MAG: molybdate ABC transporter substrate-binding protein [Candidatus Nezhaarchaeales archaeon]
MRKIVAVMVVLIVIAGVSGYLMGSMVATKAKSLVMFAGAALKAPGEELIEIFGNATGVKVDVQWGGSGKVLSSLEISKSGDIFLSGSPDYMIKAINDGVVDPKSIRIIAYLVPAIIVPKDNPKNITCLEDLAKPGIRVGIGNPDYVCVGKYAKELLQYNGLWDNVSKNIVVYAESCSKTASLVVTGSVDAIIGWHVFHYWNPDETEIIWLKPEQIPKISYICAAVTKYCHDRNLAEIFLDFLANSEISKIILRQYGYLTHEDVEQYAPYAEIPVIGQT